jgi:hypothetical protein
MLANMEITDLQYADPQHTVIQCMIKLPGASDFIFYAADENGPEPYGKTVYADAIAGVYGEIKPFIKNKDFGAPKFSITKNTYGSFNVYRVSAVDSGSITYSGDKLDIDRAKSRRVSMVTSGSRKYESVNNQFPPVVLGVGDYNLDLPNMQANDTYKITAMEPNTEYHCISRVDLQPYKYERVSASAGQQLHLLAGRSLFIGGGRVSGADAPTVVYKTDEERTLDVEANMFGLIFW